MRVGNPHRGFDVGSARSSVDPAMVGRQRTRNVDGHVFGPLALGVVIVEESRWRVGNDQRPPIVDGRSRAVSPNIIGASYVTWEHTHSRISLHWVNWVGRNVAILVATSVTACHSSKFVSRRCTVTTPESNPTP